MKKLPLVALLLTIIFNTSFTAYSQHTLSLGEGGKSPKASIRDVSWIAGHWTGAAFGGTAEEVWSRPAGNSMMGMFRLLKDGKVQFYEIENISEVNETLILRLKHFHRDLKGWEDKDETIDFPLVKIDGKKACFEGLTFEKISESEMTVYVLLGTKDGQAEEVKIDFRLMDK